MNECSRGIKNKSPYFLENHDFSTVNKEWFLNIIFFSQKKCEKKLLFQQF